MKKKNGFTLIELLVVTLIIAILTTVALPQYRKSVQKAYLAEMNTLIATFRDALAAYGNEFNTYPTQIDQMTLPFDISEDADEAMKFTTVDLDKGLTIHNKDNNNTIAAQDSRVIVFTPKKRTNISATFYITMTEHGFPVYVACAGKDCDLLDNFNCVTGTDLEKIYVCRSLFD
ncbi:MAG: type II secretion system protein [Elusimicrobiaceae bacterium]|nr:type II secretion system protein [Elusimicrobiaceae bacterium]